MCHSHTLKPVGKLVVKPKVVVDEEMIDSDKDSYGDEGMEFDDKDPVKPIQDNKDEKVDIC